MAKAKENTTYYATNDAEGGNSGSDTNGVWTTKGTYSKANLGSVTLSNPVDGATYSCHFKVTVEDSESTMLTELQTHSSDYEFKVYGTGVGGSSINEKEISLSSLETPIEFDVELTQDGIAKNAYYAEFAIKNTTSDQSYLAGKNLNLTIKTDIACEEKTGA